MTLAGQVSLAIEKTKPDAVFVDAGGVGGGVVDRLHQLSYTMVMGVDFGGKATNFRRYHNKRSEMWGEMAEWVRDGGAIPADQELISEIVAPKYDFAPDGSIRLESKDSMKKRGLPSPDKGDAVALTFAYHVAKRLAGEKNTVTAEHEYDPLRRETNNV